MPVWYRCDGFGAAVSTAERETSHNGGSFPRLLATFRGILGCSQKILLRGVLCPSANPQPAFWPWIAISSKQSDQTTKLSSLISAVGWFCWDQHRDLKFLSVGRAGWGDLWGLGTSNFITFSVELNSVKTTLGIQNRVRWMTCPRLGRSLASNEGWVVLSWELNQFSELGKS